MHERVYQITKKEAICWQTDSFQSDGMKKCYLPFPVVRFNINLSSIDHSIMAFDSNWLVGLFLTNYCKALSRAFDCKGDFHKNEVIKTESRERLEKYSIRFTTNGAFTPIEINVPVVSKARELATSRLNYLYICKCMN